MRMFNEWLRAKFFTKPVVAEEKEIPLCIDCAHYSTKGPYTANCFREQEMGFSPVTGYFKKPPVLCHEERTDHRCFTRCGSLGQFFVPKAPKDSGKEKS